MLSHLGILDAYIAGEAMEDLKIVIRGDHGFKGGNKYSSTLGDSFFAR